MEKTLVTVKLEIATCCVCGIPFGLPDYHRQHLLETGEEFYCPNGHAQVYSKPIVSELKKQLAQAKKEAELYNQWYAAERGDHEQTRRKLGAVKGVLTKTKKRIANGVCPCCRRTFVNLHRHMGTKHPDYVSEA